METEMGLCRRSLTVVASPEVEDFDFCVLTAEQVNFTIMVETLVLWFWSDAARLRMRRVETQTTHNQPYYRPQIRQDYPPNLSI